MEPSAAEEDALRKKFAHLNAELEQALVAAEDAQKEVVALVRERDALAVAYTKLRANYERSGALRPSVTEVAALRAKLASILRDLSEQRVQEAANAARDEELAVALEEAQTL